MSSQPVDWQLGQRTPDGQLSTMRELAETLLLLALLLGASYIGLFLQRWMREHHRSRDTVDAVRLVITILVTFAALVLGLLVTSVKSNFDAHTEGVRHLGTRLVELDARLREYGPQVDPIRAMIRRYTAAAIATTWPDEPAPKGDYPSRVTSIRSGSVEGGELTELLMRADEMISTTADGDHASDARGLSRPVRDGGNAAGALGGDRVQLFRRSPGRSSCS